MDPIEYGVPRAPWLRGPQNTDLWPTGRIGYFVQCQPRKMNHERIDGRAQTAGNIAVTQIDNVECETWRWPNQAELAVGDELVRGMRAELKKNNKSVLCVHP